MIHPFYNAAEAAIVDLASYKDCTPQETLDALEELESLVGIYIDAIKEDLKNNAP